MPNKYFAYLYQKNTVVKSIILMFLIFLIFLDKRLVTLSRLSGAVNASVVVLKLYDSYNKVFHPVLQVMKLYSTSGREFIQFSYIDYSSKN